MRPKCLSVEDPNNNDVFDVVCGSDITDTIAEAIELSAKKERTIKFEFNGVTVSVRLDSNPELIYRDWERALDDCISKNVGPNPDTVLTDAEKESDARIKAENESKHQKRLAKYVEKTEAKKKSLEDKLSNAPDIEILGDKRWHWFNFKEDNLTDSYGGAVVLYATRWAQLMQVEMVNGRKLKDVAKATSQEADTDNITGSMYGCAVSILSQCWKHGEQLRRWHNIKT